jgi:hypothetical protein
MTRCPISKAVLVTIFVTSLVASAASAADRPGSSHARTPMAKPAAGLLWIWNSVTGFLRKEGCGLDPNGSSLASDAGCTIDPDGRCGAALTGPVSQDAGCTIDPNGRCPTGG